MKKVYHICFLLLFGSFFGDSKAQEINGVNIISNPTFNVDAAGWGSYFDYYWEPANPMAASGNVSVLEKSGYAGKVCKVAVFNAGTAPYAVQISTSVPLEAGKKYSMKFKASADAARTILIAHQQDIGPKTTWYTSDPISLTTTPTSFGPFIFTATTTDPSNLFKFYMGGGGASGAVAAYFDDVEVTELINVPGATIPGAPTMGIATAGSSRAVVSFTASTNTGGISIKSYTVTSNPGSIAATGTTSPIIVNGLTNGQAYTFTVVANNALGASVASAPSNSVTPVFQPTTYYVSSITGRDNNYGTSSATPFATIAKASSVMVAGDTALIMTGIYPPLTISQSGNQFYNITYKALKGNNPIITCGPEGAWYLLQISASYITIDGLEIKGINSSLTLAQGEANYNVIEAALSAGKAPPYNSTVNTNTNGVSIGDKNLSPVHHVVLKNCRIHDCSAGGVGGTNADYLTIENNEIYNNSWFCMWATSGISVIDLVSIDNITSSKIVIRGNKVYNNYCSVKWITIKDYSDGNGIIIDVNTGYKASFLVENNVVFNNGGRGLYIMDAGNAIFRNNTSYWNSKSRFSTGGEMVCYNAHDVIFVNNIGWANPAYSSENYAICDNGNWGTNSNITWKNNLAFNGTVNQSSTFFKRTSTISIDNSNKTGVNPLFVSASINPGIANFKLLQNSPALNAGTAVYGVPANDIEGFVRVQDGSIDVGAYETAPVVPPAGGFLTFTAKRIDALNAQLSWKTIQDLNIASFDVEKGEDGQIFEKLAGVGSGGSSGNNYQFVDNNATAMRSYYRIKMIYKDGSFKYSNIELVIFDEIENSVAEIYPNPVLNQSANIKVLAKEDGIWTISATNVVGQKVILQKTNLSKGFNLLSIDVTSLSAGMHFLKVEKSGEVFIRRFIKF